MIRKWSGHLGSPAYPSGALIEYVRIGGKLNFIEHAVLDSAWGCIRGTGETKGLLFHQALVREDRGDSVGS